MASRMVERARPLLDADPSIERVIDELGSSFRLAGIADPRRTATDIVAALLDVPRSWPLANREASLEPSLVAAAREASRKLILGAPFAYAVRVAAFRHLNLAVDERVLIPRPETELLVEVVLTEMGTSRSGSWGIAADIGTGSGAIALALAAEGRFDRIVATDVSSDALAVARRNELSHRSMLRAPVEYRQGSFLAPMGDGEADVIVSNPPYIAFSEIEFLPASVRDWEPPLALFSGHDGMRATSEIVRGSRRVLVPDGLLALEVDERRASLVAELMMQDGAYRDVGVRLDLAGRERFVTGRRR